MLAPIAKVVNKEDIFLSTYFVNNSIRYKLDKVLTPWENKNFLFWIVMNETGNNVKLIVQSIHMPDCITLVFDTTLSNWEASLYENVKLFREALKDTKNLAFDVKNVIINKWWKNYLWALPKQPGFQATVFKKENV